MHADRSTSGSCSRRCCTAEQINCNMPDARTLDDQRLQRTACLNCALQRRRCERPADGGDCFRCSRLRRECISQLPGSEGKTTRETRTIRKPTKQRVVAPKGTARLATAEGLGHGLSGGSAFPAPVASPPLSPSSSSPSALALASPSFNSGDLAISDVILAGMRGWWERCHPAFPLIHRGAFEAAFNPDPSPHYGANQPSALMFALAANGLPYADLPGIAEAQRNALSAACLQAARDAVVAGFVSRESPLMTDLEALQAVFLILFRCLPEGRALEAFVPLASCSHVLKRTCLDPATGELVGAREAPADHVQWVANEMRWRLWLVVGHIEINFWYYTRRPTMFPYLEHTLPLPASELYFDMPSSEAAFDLLSRTRMGRLAETVDLSPFVDPCPELEHTKDVVHSLVGSIFSRRASHLLFAHLGSGFRALRSTLRDHAEHHGIDLLSLASQEPSSDTPEQAVYRRFAQLYCSLAAESLRPLAPDVGLPLELGDAVPFLLLSNLSCPAYAHVALGYFIILRASSLECWFEGDDGSPRAALFSSQEMASALETCVVIARWMRSQLSVDAELRHPVLGTIVAGIRVAKIGVAAAAMLAGLDDTEVRVRTEEDVRSVLRYVETAAAPFQHARAAVDDLRRTVIAAGIAVRTDGTPTPVEQDSTPGNEGAGSAASEVGSSPLDPDDGGSSEPLRRSPFAQTVLGVDSAMGRRLLSPAS
ncbi:hypothetical protein DFJ74DRAFT_193951 [Hyaloraphidium curvatum]|nr:hypothetical protein DFJ74DRAFT_193951 [Hyaloraphidium curvatum]